MGTRDTGEETLTSATLVEATADQAAAHLQEVLASHPFRSSPRSCDFLRHVVTLSLNNRAELLRERQIGEAIFGRAPDYDTGQDSIVRVKANEVRRRLAQYYDLHPNTPFRFDLPTGSYVVQIHRRPASEVEAVPVSQSRISWLPGRRITVLLLLVVSIALAAGVVLRPAPRAFETFWAPLAEGSGPLLISVPHPEVYRIYGADKDRLVKAFPARPRGQPPPAQRDPVQDVIIFPEHNLYVGIGDARSLALIHSLLQGFDRQPIIRRANETGFTELRGGASVLLGGFTNRWTLEFTKTMPFTLRAQGSDWGIYEARTGRGICVKPKLWEPASNQDCAVIARIMNSKSGKPVFIAAGVDHYGTFAVGEFLTRPDLLGPALAAAPRDWPRRNLEIVIQVEVVGDNVGPPKVLAAEVW